MADRGHKRSEILLIIVILLLIGLIAESLLREYRAARKRHQPRNQSTSSSNSFKSRSRSS